MPRTSAPVLSVTLGLSLALALGPRDAAAQSPRDSIRMDLQVYEYMNTEDGWTSCGAGIVAIWPDLAADVLGVETSYSFYDKAATEGMRIPGGYGEAHTDPDRGISVPDGFYGHNPQLNSGGSGPGSADAALNCSKYVESANARLGGGEGLLNGQPFRITEWYAVYDVPAGTPIADFTWDQPEGTTINFDGAFPTSREVELIGRVPVASYEWDFGDGGSSSAPSPSYIYAEPGEYSVTLTVTDDDGETNERTRVVKVSSVVLQYTTYADESANVADTLGIFAIIKNTGTAAAVDVSASRGFYRYATYPENPTSPQNATATPTRPTTDTTFARIEPGESVFIYQFYKIDKVAQHRVDGKWLPTPVDWEADMVSVRGFDEDGNPAEIVDHCKESECDNMSRIFIDLLTVKVETSTTDGTTTNLASGLKRFTGLEAKFWFFHLLPPNTESAICSSGCLEMEITVTDEDGQPVEGAEVKLTRVLTDTRVTPPSIVTPDQGGGIFCDDTKCDTELTLAPTDADGKQSARFWAPGVIWDVDAELTATASKTAFADAERKHEIVIKPTRAEVGVQTANPTQADINALSAISILNVLSGFDIEGYCAWAMGKLTEPTADVAYGIIEEAAKRAIDSVCGTMVKKYIYDKEDLPTYKLERVDRAQFLLDFLKQYTTALSVWWFEGQFDLSTTGTGNFALTVIPPFVEYESEFVDAILEANQQIAIQATQTVILPVLQLDLHEVSHKQEDGEEVKAFHMEVSTSNAGDDDIDYKKIISAGYSPVTFLSQHIVEANTAAASSASDQSVSFASGPGKTAVDSTFAVGQIIAIDVDTEFEERAQIVAITESTLELSVPLKYNHAAGARMRYVGLAAVGPPDAPMNVGGLSGMPGFSTTPTLEWHSLAPASSYQVEVATDTLFANVVQSATDLADPTITLDELDDRTRYFWRAASTNLLGQSEWSMWYSFFTGRPLGDDLAEATVLEDELDYSRVALHYGATTETGEAVASCGAGDNSVWYSYTPGADLRVAFSTFDSSFNTTLSVWTGTAHPLTEVVCNDDYDNGPHPTIAQSYVEFDAVAGTTYYVRIAGNPDGAGTPESPGNPGNDEGLLFATLRTPTAVGVEEAGGAVAADVPTELALEVYPNPAAQTANIVVHMPDAGRTTVKLYDLLGRERVAVAGGDLTAGTHELQVDVTGLPAGVYILRLARERDSVVRMLTIAK